MNREYNEILYKINNLSKKDQLFVLKELKRTIEVVTKLNNKSTCEMIGHNFSKWQNETRSKFIEKNFNKDNNINEYFVEYPLWTRTCKSCGYVEQTRIKPKTRIKTTN